MEYFEEKRQIGQRVRTCSGIGRDRDEKRFDFNTPLRFGIIIISNEGAGCDLEIMARRESSLCWIVTSSDSPASFAVPRAEEGGHRRVLSTFHCMLQLRFYNWLVKKNQGAQMANSSVNIYAFRIFFMRNRNIYS
ncbi:hypothetical protein TorRG33x02_106310 [Trema orientale]|uniref:Uncharacterized protein n=1 Tax=Trema orientale TaxID=63057 RepID=A0A2P5F788_TREOI|nr:hypothetical protein TorRG33x02_106310 [Trema orientale]